MYTSIENVKLSEIEIENGKYRGNKFVKHKKPIVGIDAKKGSEKTDFLIKFLLNIILNIDILSSRQFTIHKGNRK